VASPVEIARWLERFAPDELEIAEERVRLLEQRPYAAITDTGSTPTVHVDWSLATTQAEHSRPGWRGRAIGAGAALFGTAIVALVIAAKKTPDTALGAAAAPPAPTVESTPPLVAAPAAAAASEAVATPARVPSSPAQSTSRAPRRPGKSACNPPFTIDANGHKHYNPNCF
jgi:serine/threonine-protein kinase